MFRASLRRGLTAGAVGGLLFGLFTALVGNPLVGYTESLAHAHDHAPGGGHVVPETVTAVASVAGGVVWGVLLGGAVFGVVYYLTEPALPGSASTKRYVLAAAGFVTVSGAPWLLLPPQPAGVAGTAPVGTQIGRYLAAAAAGAVACGLAVAVFRRLTRAGVTVQFAALPALLPVGVLAALLALGPSGAAGSDIPEAVVLAYRGVVVAGQVGLWVVLAVAHGWLSRRERERLAVGPDDALPAD